MTLSCANPQIWETLARRVSVGTSSSTNVCQGAEPVVIWRTR